MAESVKRTGVENHQEWHSSAYYRDARPIHVRIADWMGHPKRMAFLAGGIACTSVLAPLLAIPAFVFGLILLIWWETIGKWRKELPLQIPKQIGSPDPSEIDPKTRRPRPGAGMMYLGNNRSSTGESEECWLNDSQARTHFLMAGTTGSGKTMTLLGVLANALTWASGCIYTDGKADNSLSSNAYSLARRFGRDDHVYVLNFMTGGQDIFVSNKGGKRRSNTFNPMTRGGSDDLTQLMTSLMAEASGESGMWRGLAVGMMDAVIRGLCYRRFKEGLEIDATIIRDSIELSSLIEMARYFVARDDVPKDLVVKPIEAYLRNLPALDWDDQVIGGAQVDSETKKQHDFRSMQFLRQLTMIADTYGKIFRAQIPEVDMLDIVLNNRILIVMIPSMEKSEEEAGAVGKLVVTALRMMMAMNLGDQVEGFYEDIVESKATSSPSPFVCILDELGYYFTKGLAVIFAQARSLGFSMVAALQDFPALMKGSNKEEAESVIANTKLKMALAMEDSERTADFFIKTAGKAFVTEVSGYSGNVGAITSTYRDMMDASLQERDRVTLQELRALQTSDAITMWRERVVRLTTFAPFLSGASATRKLEIRLNRLLGIHPPAMSAERSEIERFAEPEGEHRNVQLLIEQLIVGMYVPTFEFEKNSYAQALHILSGQIPNEETVIPVRDADMAIFSRLCQIVTELERINENNSSGEKTDSTVGEGSISRKESDEDSFREETLVADDLIDAAQFLSDGLPYDEPLPAQNGGEGQEGCDWISSTVGGALENVTVRSNLKSVLAETDSVLSARRPGEVEEAERILQEGVQYTPATPPPAPVDQVDAVRELEEYLKLLSGV